MQTKKILVSIIAATVVSGAFAAGENVVSSKAYVDTKQAKIPVTGTNSGIPGTTVVTYTGVAGQIGERGIYDGSGEYEANKLATAGMVKGAISAIPTVETSKLVCANSPDCTLWTIQGQTVHGSSSAPALLGYGESCTSNSQCASNLCPTSGYMSGKCACTTDAQCQEWGCDAESPDFCHCVGGFCSGE